MAITNRSNVNNASAVFKDIFTEVFLGDQQTQFQSYTMEMPVTGKSRLELPFLSAFPRARKWEGLKVYTALRSAKITIDVEPYEESTSVQRVDWRHNPEFVGSQLKLWLQSQNDFKNKILVDALLDGVTELGYDGVSFFSTAHPNGPDGGTQSNRTTNALTFANFRTAEQSMMSLRDESGRSLGMRPDTIIVSPDNYHTALEITKSKLADVAGAGTNAVENVNATQMGPYKVVVDANLKDGTADNYWFLVDSRYKPLVLGTARDVEPVDDADDYKSESPDVHLSLEADLAVGYGIWQGVHANLAT